MAARAASTTRPRPPPAGVHAGQHPGPGFDQHHRDAVGYERDEDQTGGGRD